MQQNFDRKADDQRKRIGGEVEDARAIWVDAFGAVVGQQDGTLYEYESAGHRDQNEATLRDGVLKVPVREANAFG